MKADSSTNKIDGQTESSVTGWFSFRNDGDFVAKDDGTVLEYSKGGEHGDVATLDKFTGKLTLLKNDLTKRLINNRASENVSDALALPLCVRATYQDQEITVENGSFIVYVQRPLNAMAKEINASDCELHAWETDLKDIVTLYDWRGLSWGELKPDMNSGNGFYYYNVKSIVVTGANHVSDLPNVIQITKFDSGDYSTYYPLGDEKSNFTFSYSPQDRIDVDGYVTKTFGTFGVEWSSALESYNFNLKIPVTINYEWGTIESEVIIKFQGKPRCATPTITIKDGKLHFECETEGVKFKYDIQANGSSSGEGNDLDITQSYVVKVYATKARAYYYRKRTHSITQEDNKKWVLQRLADTRGVLYRLAEMSDTLPAAEREAMQRRIDQLTMDYLYNVITLTHNGRFLEKCVNELTQKGLFPLPDKDYTQKYKWFRRITSSRQGRRLLCMLLK